MADYRQLREVDLRSALEKLSDEDYQKLKQETLERHKKAMLQGFKHNLKVVGQLLLK